jgi:hypothetical protein
MQQHKKIYILGNLGYYNVLLWKFCVLLYSSKGCWSLGFSRQFVELRLQILSLRGLVRMYWQLNSHSGSSITHCFESVLVYMVYRSERDLAVVVNKIWTPFLCLSSSMELPVTLQGLYCPQTLWFSTSERVQGFDQPAWFHSLASEDRRWWVTQFKQKEWGWNVWVCASQVAVMMHSEPRTCSVGRHLRTSLFPSFWFPSSVPTVPDAKGHLPHEWQNFSRALWLSQTQPDAKKRQRISEMISLKPFILKVRKLIPIKVKWFGQDCLDI